MIRAVVSHGHHHGDIYTPSDEPTPAEISTSDRRVHIS